ncbi:MAG TPA: T9SS type A sorting domain-containing protein [Bacteroidia bacterium]|jgi:metal-sulfur cluster biosynthetic enzyme
MRKAFTIICLLICSIVFGQGLSKKVLFLGNSYTAVNNLPQMLADVAASTNDTVLFDSNTPGGYTLEQHSTNATSLNKIAIGNWDYVVLQEQSQLPSFPDAQVQSSVLPFAKSLDSTINADNLCGETVFYMTWGRKNGDASNCASWPPVCTYTGMDSLLSLRYKIMADSNNAILSPVGAVWKHLRQNFPLIELYSADESHPSVAGTYAAACCFYSSLFRKDPTFITFNASLSPADAVTIRNAAKLIVYDSLLNWHIGEYDPSANFSYASSGSNQITFTNTSANATVYFWSFGDGNTSALVDPTHLYPAAGSYTVTLTASECGMPHTIIQTVTVAVTALSSFKDLESSWNIFPNPATTSIVISLEKKGIVAYRIYSATGKVILKSALNSEKQIDITMLPDGMYFLELYDDDLSFGLNRFIKAADR